MSCSRCEDSLILEDAIKCSMCENSMHYGCGSMTETSFRKLGKERKLVWKCPDCKMKKDTTTKTQSTTIISGSAAGGVGGGSSDGSDGHKSGNGESALMEQFNKLANELRASMSELERSVQYASNQSDSMLTEFQELKKTFQDLQKNQQDLMNENVVLKKTVKDLKNQVHEVDQRSLDHNVEINGVPETIQEERVLPLLCDAMNIPAPDVSHYTVKRSRVGAPGRIKPVHVQFESKYTRNQILKASKGFKPKASHITKDPKDTGNVYVNEELTPHNRELFFNANKIKKEKQFRYLWVAEGKILLKKSDQARTIRIRDVDDMN
uniref:Zinc finger PHD-type domain-containing protein n=1 Tax=Cacopsylla melanoneura TaxID=428564 RepID=A0A8D8ZBT7_9HEMI